MKKRIGKVISVVLAAAMILSLAGCGSSDPAESAPAETGTETTASDNGESSTQAAAAGERL